MRISVWSFEVIKRNYINGDINVKWNSVQKKGHVMNFGKRRTSPDWDYKLKASSSQVSHKEKDLGLVINSKLSTDNLIMEKR